MNRSVRVLITTALIAACARSPSVPSPSPDLAGTWRAQRTFGPLVGGPLLLRRVADGWSAEIGLYRAAVETVDGRLSFALPTGERFDGWMPKSGPPIAFWTQARSRLDSNRYATPLKLEAHGDSWLADVRPVPDTATFRLELRPEADGALRADLINWERNLGVFQVLSRAERRGNDVLLWGTFRGRGSPSVQLQGRYHPDEDVLSVRYPGRGGGYDFVRAEPEAAPAVDLGRPPELDDGWPTADAGSVGLDLAPIRKMVETHILPISRRAHDLRIHAVLIARHGRLVVEAYFRGHHRHRLHDSRSASKTVAAILAAAVRRQQPDLSWDSPIYPLFGRDLAERRGITLRHLVHMASGLDCDDRDPESAANEDYLWDHATELDFYAHTLGVRQVHPPGAVTAYCSASSNLAAGAVAAAAGEDLRLLLHRTVMAPLGIERYGLVIPPDGRPYFGGGLRFRARDLLKFPQLILDRGRWKGREVISEDDAARFTRPEVKVGNRDYGYLIWTKHYPYRGRTVQGHYMAGNGGQIAMVVPELGLSIAFNGGNYSDRVMYRIQDELVPEFILPAVKP